MTFQLVDPPEVVEVHDRERHPRVVPRGPDPLSLQLLLEGPVVAQARERVAQRLGSSARVGVLEDDPCLVQTFGRLQHAAGQPDGEDAQQHRHDDDEDRRDEHRLAPADREPIDHGSRDSERDGEHRHEGDEQAQPDDPQVGRSVEDRVCGVAVAGHVAACVEDVVGPPEGSDDP